VLHEFQANTVSPADKHPRSTDEGNPPALDRPRRLEDDNQSDPTNERRHINWGAISGLALSLAISASFWAGVGVLISRMVK
jgi:hypothetical protein